MPVDGAKGCIRAFTQSRRQYPQLKVILSIGGGGAGSENFAAVAADPMLTVNFVETAKNLVDKFTLDGLDSTILPTHTCMHVLFCCIATWNWSC